MQTPTGAPDGRRGEGLLQDKRLALAGGCESGEVNAKFFVESFVVMQYFDYLGKDADALYINWIQVLGADPANYRVMVNGFVNSLEYRQRFGR